MYAGKVLSMDDEHFCGLLMNLDGVSRTEIRLENGLRADCCWKAVPESKTDEAFSLLFAEAEGLE